MKSKGAQPGNANASKPGYEFKIRIRVESEEEAQLIKKYFDRPEFRGSAIAKAAHMAALGWAQVRFNEKLVWEWQESGVMDPEKYFTDRGLWPR